MEPEQENAPKTEIVDDPIEFAQRIMDSELFREQYEAFDKANPIPHSALSELADNSPETKENYQKYRFLSQNGEDLVHFYTTYTRVELKYKRDYYPTEVREHINTYVSHVIDFNNKFSGLDLDERTRYSNLRSGYHNASADSIAEYLTNEGILPQKPFKDSLPLRGFGRGITSMILRSRHPELDKIEHYT